jgi:hypothetical protein
MFTWTPRIFGILLLTLLLGVPQAAVASGRALRPLSHFSAEWAEFEASTQGREYSVNPEPVLAEAHFSFARTEEMLEKSVGALLPVSEESTVVPARPAGESLDTLVDWMTGSFGSGRQAASDSAYYDIRLEMVRIWTARTDGAWLYVEQAVAASTDRPYRQRVYHVTQIENDLFKSEVFAIPEAQDHAGEWRVEEPLADLTPEDLEPRKGCAVFLRRSATGEFDGSTVGRSCASGLRGAAYATSEVTVGPGRIESWDRGFDEHGVQVWGAEKGRMFSSGSCPRLMDHQTDR